MWRPVLLAPHPRDPQALVLRPLWDAARATDFGAWAGKLRSHEAHHRFGTLGRLPHLQLNLWRVGVKGSGVAVRLPLVSPTGAARVMLQMLP